MTSFPTVPDLYVCNACNTIGSHWIMECNVSMAQHDNNDISIADINIELKLDVLECVLNASNKPFTGNSNVINIESEELSKEPLYCVCRKSYQEDDFLIMCDLCNEWYHGYCININENDADDIEEYDCFLCCGYRVPSKGTIYNKLDIRDDINQRVKLAKKNRDSIGQQIKIEKMEKLFGYRLDEIIARFLKKEIKLKYRLLFDGYSRRYNNDNKSIPDDINELISYFYHILNVDYMTSFINEESEEIKELRYSLKKTKEKLNCGVCQEREKNVLLTKCLHMFCKQCIDQRTKSRNRKCPICSMKYDPYSDIKSIYL